VQFAAAFDDVLQPRQPFLDRVDVVVDLSPNHKQAVKKGVAPWDAYLQVQDPDARGAGNRLLTIPLVHRCPWLFYLLDGVQDEKVTR